MHLHLVCTHALSYIMMRDSKSQQVERLENKSNYIKTNIVDLSKEHSFPHCVQSNEKLHTRFVLFIQGDDMVLKSKRISLLLQVQT